MLKANELLGFLNINKPAGMTAHDVVARVRRILRVKRVGHGGTLDPMATGVLPVAVGRACRLLRYLPGNKVYLADILLGTATTTDDIEGEVVRSVAQLPAEPDVTEALRSFQGEVDQVPPAFSAIHHQGERLYKLARAGAPLPDIPARKVMIYSVAVTGMALPVVQARIVCGTGTYIRSIARDLGRMLSCGGCLQALVREQSGPFVLADAITLKELEELVVRGEAQRALVSPGSALGLPSLSLGATEIRLLSTGQFLTLAGEQDSLYAADAYPNRSDKPEDLPIAVTYEGELIAVCRKTHDNKLKAEVVIVNAD